MIAHSVKRTLIHNVIPTLLKQNKIDEYRSCYKKVMLERCYLEHGINTVIVHI